MTKKKKLPYLLTSPEQFQQTDGNGSSNMDSPTVIGKPIAAILRKPIDSSSPTESPSSSPKDGLSLWETLNGSTTEIDTIALRQSVIRYLSKLSSLKI